MSLHRDIRLIREQMRSDFETTMLGLATQRDAMITAIKDASEKQEAILREHVEKMDDRFDEVLQVIEEHAERMDGFEERLKALEQERKAG